MQKTVTFIIFFSLLWLCPAYATTSRVEVRGVRVWPSPGAVRVVFDVNKPVDYHIFALKNPRRLVIDFNQVALKTDLKKMLLKTGLIKGHRYAMHADGRLRVVFDLAQSVHVNPFSLPPNSEYGHRLVIDIDAVSAPVAKPASKVAVHPVDHPKFRPFVVAIDPGHGGEDPGAKGFYGTREKVVAFQIAKVLSRLINALPGMRAVLIREGDYYVGLRARMQKARKHRADLFVSIHADSFTHRRARGASVFVLSPHGASSEAAKLLARRENQSDILGGVHTDRQDGLLTRVLLDLSQTAAIKDSLHLGNLLLKQLNKTTILHKKSVQRAGFMVLKSPDIPSVLIETGFISHPPTEKKLRDPNYQKVLALAIRRGIMSYVETIKRS